MYRVCFSFSLMDYFRFRYPPKFNSSPLKKWCLEDDPFLLGFGNFSGAMLNFGVFHAKRAFERCE